MSRPVKTSVYLLLLLTSCIRDDKRVDLNCKYNGAVVYEKYDYRLSFRSNNEGVSYDLKYHGKIIHVSVYQIDYNYNVGDTILGECIENH